MPQLGMAQNSAIIVSWNKSVGDAVSTGEMLLEVETDKAVMEVEARHDGFVTEILISAGSDVPVGQVIAVISATADAPVLSESSVTDSSAPVSTTAQLNHTGVVPQLQSTPSASVDLPPEGRGDVQENRHNGSQLLASPKARRLAFERGIDLQSLADAGLSQPFHAMDIPLSSAVDTGTARRQTAMLQTTSDLSAFDEFITWSKAEVAGGCSANVQEICPHQLWSKYFSDSLSLIPGTIIRITNHRDDNRFWSVEGEGLSTVKEVENADQWDLDVIDFSETTISDYEPAGGLNKTTLIVFANADNAGRSVTMRLYFSTGVLTTAAAANSLNSIAMRCSNPLFQLL